MSDVKVALEELQRFRPTDGGPDNIHALQRIVNLLPRGGADDSMKRAVFETIERWPNANLGMPGPLVHWLESVDGYREHLRESLERKSTFLTVWMVNRILNSLPYSQADEWLLVLSKACAHAETSANVRTQLKNILDKYEDA